MKGGIDAWNGLVSEAEVDQGIYLIDGTEAPDEVISLAYGLEDGAHRFYGDLAERTKDDEIKGLFDRLSRAEIEHREKLWEKYVAVIGGPVARELFESRTAGETMEGGKTADQVLAHYPDWIRQPHEALQLAMSLETDALDLYLRMAQKTQNEETRGIFYSLADEERVHLRRLGELLRSKLPVG